MTPTSRDRYPHRTATTQNKCGQTSMPWVEFEPTMTVFHRVGVFHASDRAATVIGLWTYNEIYVVKIDSGMFNTEFCSWKQSTHFIELQTCVCIGMQRGLTCVVSLTFCILPVASWQCFRWVRYRHYTTSDRMKTDECTIRNNLEGSSRGLIEVLSRNLRGATEDVHENREHAAILSALQEYQA
jgi:hypothetical protein